MGASGDGLYVRLDLVDDDNKPAGYLYKIYKRKPDIIPRVGEDIYLDDELYSKVARVHFGGHGLEAVHLVLEPINESYRIGLQSLPENKAHNGWKFRNESD